MKRLLCFIIALLFMLSLCACSNGGSNAPITDASSLSAKTTRKQFENLLGTPDQDDKNKDDKKDHYTLFYTRVDFFNMFCSPELYFRKSNDTLMGIYLETRFDKDRRNGVDELKRTLTNQLGAPKVDFQNDYTNYYWGERIDDDNAGDYKSILIRNDGIVLIRLFYNAVGLNF